MAVLKHFEVLEDGEVCRHDAGGPRAVAVGPRCIVTRDGQAICSYMSQNKIGLNDFVPMLTRAPVNDLRSWSTPAPIWPDLADRFSIFGSISQDREGNLYLFGSRTPIDVPGESFWSDETRGLKQNELVWATCPRRSGAWSDPQSLGMPIPGSAEAPGPMLVTRTGRWIAPYSPYNVFDPAVRVDREQVVVVCSDDQGRTWTHGSMIRFDEPETGGAEAWVTELSDGRLLGVTWQVDLSGKQVSFPNRYAISRDQGTTWGPTRSTGILGNTTALAPLDDHRALFVNVRRSGSPGIFLSVVKPTDETFGILADQCIWSAPAVTQSGGPASHDNWVDFSFGEPAITTLPDGSLVLVFWYLEQKHAGVRYIRLRMAK